MSNGKLADILFMLRGAKRLLMNTQPYLMVGMLVPMMVIAVVPDLFHHVPMQHAMASEAGSPDSDQQQMPHQPLSCSLLHAGHLCHAFASITAIVPSEPAVSHAIYRSQETSPVDDFPAGIFHPPRS